MKTKKLTYFKAYAVSIDDKQVPKPKPIEYTLLTTRCQCSLIDFLFFFIIEMSDGYVLWLWIRVVSDL